MNMVHHANNLSCKTWQSLIVLPVGLHLQANLREPDLVDNPIFRGQVYQYKLTLPLFVLVRSLQIVALILMTLHRENRILGCHFQLRIQQNPIYVRHSELLIALFFPSTPFTIIMLPNNAF